MDYDSSLSSSVRKYLISLGAAGTNMVNNASVSNVGDYYNLLSEVQFSRLLQSQPYLNALFMTNAASVVNRNTESSNLVSSSLPSRSSNTASSPVSLGSSTGVNRRNVSLNAAEDYQEIDLDGHRTPSIVVGGEPRIPLPCIESMVLHLIKQSVMKDKLAEHCIRPVECTENESALLRSRLRSSDNGKKIQLLSYSLAEFVIRSLLHDKGKVISRTETVEVRPGVRVKGRVFGKQRGFFRSDLYKTADAQCIECDTCGTYFSPDKFVGHTHQPEMLGVVHWGYKPAEWRRYLCLFRDKKTKDMSIDEIRQHETFVEMLNRFNTSSRNSQQSKRKTLITHTSKNIDHTRKRSHVKTDVNEEIPPVKRVTSNRDLIGEAISSINERPDSLYAPNVNLGSIPHEGKSAFTPIERREVKEAVSGFSKEDAMMDRLKKQYQLVKDGVEKLHISNSEKQSMLVEWANLNQGFATLYNSMKNRIIAHKQAELQISKSITSLGSEMEGMRNDNLDLKSQMSALTSENEALKRKYVNQREPVPVKDRILYQNAKDDLEKNRTELRRSQAMNQSLREENEQLKAKLIVLMNKESSSEPVMESNSTSDAQRDSYGNYKITLSQQQQQQHMSLLAQDKLQQELNIKAEDAIDVNDDDSDEIDSAATESAPGSSQPGSPEGPVSPFDVAVSLGCTDRVKLEVSSREHDEDMPTLTREQD